MAKMKYRTSLSYPNEGTNDTPFNNNLKEFDEFIGESRKRERAWRRATFVLLSFLLASVLGWLYVSSLAQGSSLRHRGPALGRIEIRGKHRAGPRRVPSVSRMLPGDTTYGSSSSIRDRFLPTAR